MPKGNVLPTSFLPPGLWSGGTVTMAALTIKICASGGIHPFVHIINCSGAPAPELRNQHEIQKGDPGNRNLSPLPLWPGTLVAVALGPLCRSMPLHHATFPLVLHHRNRVAGLPPTVRHGLASPRDRPCDRNFARSRIARGSDVYDCVRKGIPKTHVARQLGNVY